MIAVLLELVEFVVGNGSDLLIEISIFNPLRRHEKKIIEVTSGKLL